MSGDKVELRALAEKATPGPWRWYGQLGRHISLTTVGRGIVSVMSAKRLGMQGAEPMFYQRAEEDRGKWGVGGVGVGASEIAVREVPYRDDIVALDNPDAAYIAAASPDVILGLLDRIEALTPVLEAAEVCVNAFFSHAVSDRVAQQRAHELDQAVTKARTALDQSMNEPRCYCGTDAALARGETTFVRNDIVCPKHR